MSFRDRNNREEDQDVVHHHPPFLQDASQIGGTEDLLKNHGKTVSTMAGIVIFFLLIGVVLGVYNMARFFILYGESYEGAPEWFNTSNVPLWIVSLLLVVTIFGTIRTGASYLTNIIKYAFKIAQSDVVTIILALVINVIMLLLGGWLTAQIMNLIEMTGVENFYSQDNFLSKIVLFLMMAAALIWIPRLGVYGENKLGQFEDSNY